MNTDETLQIRSISRLGEYLLIGTKQGVLYSFFLQDNSIKKLVDLHVEISDLFICQPDKIAIATKGKGIFMVSTQAIIHFNLSNGLNDNFIYHLVCDRQQVLWSCSDNGINRITNNNIFSFQGNDQLPDPVTSAIGISENEIFIGTQQGDLITYHLSTHNLKTYPNITQKKAQINDILVLDHTVFLATDSGLLQLSKLNPDEKLWENEKATYSISVDLEANIWYGGDELLGINNGEQLQIIPRLGNQPLSFVHTLKILGSDLWFTPDQGLIRYNIKTKKLDQITLTPESELIDITALYRDHEGFVWAGTSGRGLYRIDTSSFSAQQISIHPSTGSSHILSISGTDRELQVSGLDGIWVAPIQNHEYPFESLEDRYHLKKFYVYQICRDRLGQTWMATDGQGILRINDNGVESFSKQKNIETKVFYSICEDGKGQIWFNAMNDGVYCNIQDSLVHLNAENGLQSNDILSISPLGKSYFLAVSSKGIDLIHTADFNVAHYNFENLGILKLPELNSITVSEEEIAYIGTNHGIISLHLPSYKKQFSPSIQLDGLSAMNVPKNPNQNTFPFDSNYLEFRFSCNSFTPDIIYYRYRLEGLNDKWVQTSNQEVIFPRLEPGKYTLTLQSANNRSFNHPSSFDYSFTIAYPFWRTWWFIACISLISFSIIYFIFRMRVNQAGKWQRLEKEKAIAEFEALKIQVNPHFLFNSFNTLIHVIEMDQQKAIEYTQKLSDFYRSLLSYKDKDLVLLQEEMNLLKNYLFLQKMRFEHCLQLDIQISDEVAHTFSIPPLTLQLLAENAIKHNVINAAHPLTIYIFIQDQYIHIRNNINIKLTQEKGERIGLLNIKNRYALVTDKKLYIENDHVTFTVKLPLLNH
ncbi:MAG: histidine kinase [Chitinophagaceae bacterium]|nr:histidine kinase [Chitinophagaceae bacterium]